MSKVKCSCPHTGHRLRLRKKAVRGLDRFEPHEIAELLLFETIRRRNTNETAHRLIRRFRSLRGLLTAPRERLTDVSGIGPASAAWIASVLPEAVRFMTEDLRSGAPLERWSLLPAADLRLNVMEEPAAWLTLDADSRLLAWQTPTDPAALGRLLDTDEDPSHQHILILRRDTAERMLTGVPGDGRCNPQIFLMTPDHRLEELPRERPQEHSSGFAPNGG